MEDFNRLASKYAKVLTDLKEILHCLESEEEQQEEKQDEVGSQSSGGRLNMLSRSLHSRMNLRVQSPHPNAAKMICMGRRKRFSYAYYSTLYSETDRVEQRNLATDPTLRLHLGKEEHETVKQASSGKTVTRDLKHHEDGISEEGEIISHVAASNEEHDYAEVFQAMINTDLCS